MQGGGSNWSRGLSPCQTLTLTTEADCLPHIGRVLQELSNSCSICRLQHGPTVDYRTLMSIGSRVSEPQRTENDPPQLTWHIALTTVYVVNVLHCDNQLQIVFYILRFHDRDRRAKY